MIYCCRDETRNRRYTKKDLFKEMDTIVRQHIVFYGWVQGVGFRYRAIHAAEYYGATGWVRNDFDGSVTMEIQGRQRQIDDVIAAIERGTYVKIEKMKVKTIPVDEAEHSFRVK